MNRKFAETLRRLRAERGLSQIQLGNLLFVDHSTIARWENGNRLPDAAMIPRLSKCLGVDVNTLFSAAAESDETPSVILVDDNKVILSEGVRVLEEAIPNAAVTGFIWPQEAVAFAKTSRVALAFLDIELGRASGLDLCRTLLDINPSTNVVYLTAYADYALDAWSTGASAFMLKPLTKEGVQARLKLLRYPFPLGGAAE